MAVRNMDVRSCVLFVIVFATEDTELEEKTARFKECAEAASDALSSSAH
jgi:hypothetical protein